jgi:hypothetical protein
MAVSPLLHCLSGAGVLRSTRNAYVRPERHGEWDGETARGVGFPAQVASILAASGLKASLRARKPDRPAAAEGCSVLLCPWHPHTHAPHTHTTHNQHPWRTTTHTQQPHTPTHQHPPRTHTPTHPRTHTPPHPHRYASTPPHPHTPTARHPDTPTGPTHPQPRHPQPTRPHAHTHLRRARSCDASASDACVRREFVRLPRGPRTDPGA